MSLTSVAATLSEQFRTGFWFVPSAMTVCAVFLAWFLLGVDASSGSALTDHFGWLYSGAAQGARSVLSAIAGSMITAASVTFSLTSVALSLAAQQFGSRVLRNFMRDRITQVVLGTFISTFVYCLLVERAVRGTDAAEVFVPHLSISLGVLFALLSLILLIFFVHHVSSSIQAATIIDGIGSELEASINQLYPAKTGSSTPRGEREPDQTLQSGAPVPAVVSGYLRSIDADGLILSAKRRNAVILLCFRPGDFIVAGQVGAIIWPREAFDPELQSELADAYILGPSRTPVQDVRYSFDQLTEVAVRALSPGINDPFTALNCIDILTQELSVLAIREGPSRYRHDDEGELRIIAEPVTFPEIVNSAFEHIRTYAKSDSFVLRRLHEATETLESYVKKDEDRAVLQRHAHLLQNDLSRFGPSSER